MNSKFSILYSKLNDKQKLAVDTIDGPVMVIAGPGTGKTTILTLRIANILKQTDTPPHGILAITFTDAGVKAMKMKLREIIGSRADEVRIHTFHSFASHILHEFGDHFTHLDKMKQISEIDAEEIIRKILEDEKFSMLRPFGNTDFYVSKIIKAINDVRKENLSAEELYKFAEKEIKELSENEESYSTRGKTKGELKATVKKQIEKCQKTLLLATIFEEYSKIKKEQRKIDFSDLIYELIKTLQNDQLLLQLLQEKFLYILVDEHQDTNDAQNTIIRLMADFFDNPNVFIVGDEKQAIYRFQGASVANFLKFTSIWKNSKIIQLDKNYRSHQGILNASFGMIENNYNQGEYSELRVKLSGRDDLPKMPIDVVIASDTKLADYYLIKELSKINQDNPDKTVAVICKTNKEVERIIRLAEQEGIKISSERMVNIFDHPISNLFFNLLEVIIDTSRTDLLAHTLAGGLWNMSFAKSMEIIKIIRNTQNDSSLIEELINKIPQFESKVKESFSSGAMQYLITLANDTGYIKKIVSSPANVEIWRGMVTLFQLVITETESDDPRVIIQKILSYRKSANNRTVKIAVGTPEASIKVMTVHGSKGLEFDFVFIPSATEESWSSKIKNEYFILPFGGDDEDFVKDNRRMFYVALTRARKHVSVIVPESDDAGKELTPLRFIDECDKDSVSHIIIKHDESTEKLFAKKTESLENQINTYKNSKKQEIVEYAKTVILNKGLSVTALNHFLNCPNEFLYQSILKLPQAPSVQATKGTAFHVAIDKVWQNNDKTESNINKLLLDFSIEYINSSLLYSFEKEAVKNEILIDVPKISKSLYQHFNSAGEVYSETWSEMFFDYKINNQNVRIPLHGKLDVIIDNGTNVEVFDYKTKKAMSVNEIKGLTKNSDGGYFRQLVFYKMLLSQDSRFLDKDISPSLVFIRPDNGNECKIISLPIEDEDTINLKKDIESLIQCVWSGNLLNSKCDDPDCESCKLSSLI